MTDERGLSVMDVALASDDAYLPHAATVVHSLLTSNRPGTVTTHLLHPPELSGEHKSLLCEMVERLGGSLFLYEVGPSEVRGLPSMGRISPVMWYRLLLPKALSTVERVLYLDCDTLVVDDISDLWELDLEGHTIGAVTNVFPQDLVHRPQELGLTREQYFNSGVLLMDLEAWRRLGCANTIARLAREQPDRLVFPDQDALNIVLAKQRFPLAPRWNAQNSIFYFPWAKEVFGPAAVAEARSAPAIVHFEGPAQAKPWHSRSTHPFQQAYLDRRAQTPWPRVRLEAGGLGARLRRRILARQR